MSSEIGNKGLLKSISNFLQLLDVKQLPSSLKTDEITPVIDISRDIPAGYTMFGDQWGPVSLAGQLSQTATVRAANVGTGTFGPFCTQMPGSAKLMAFTVFYGFDAAGAAADAGERLFILGYLSAPGANQVLVVINDEFAVIEAARLEYQWCYPQGLRARGGTSIIDRQGPGWDGRIPAGWEFYIIITKQSGSGLFPVNTSCNGSWCLAVRDSAIETWPP